MKRMKLIFPLVFLIALAGSAFSRHAAKPARSQMLVYYEDTNWNTCVETEIDDDKCVVDPVGSQCMEYIGGFGFIGMWQAGFGNTCYMPFYQYN